MAEVPMVLKVDLQCSKCYKKVKKVLCEFPEIQDQVYDEKRNTVTIKVVTCCPERLMQKIYCKGGKSMKSIKMKIVIIDPPPQSKAQAFKAPKPAPESKSQSFKAPEPAPESKPQPIKAPEPASTPKALPSAPSYPPGYPNYPFGFRCRECHEGHGGGQCQQVAYGRPVCYDGYYGRPIYDSWHDSGGGWSSYNYSSHGEYEENPSTCSIM